MLISYDLLHCLLNTKLYISRYKDIFHSSSNYISFKGFRNIHLFNTFAQINIAQKLFSHIHCILRNYVRSVVLIRVNVLSKVFMFIFFTLVSLPELLSQYKISQKRWKLEKSTNNVQCMIMQLTINLSFWKIISV